MASRAGDEFETKNALPAAAQWRAVARWLGLCAGFLFIMAVALGMYLTQDWQADLATGLARYAKQKLAEGGPYGTLAAAAGAAAWLGWLALRPLTILGAFFMVEWALAGRPRDWSNSLMCLSAQVSLVVLYYFANPWLQTVLPTDALGPLLRIGHDYLPAVLVPVADLLLVTAMLVLYGLAGYWTHRAQHEIPFLWRFHSVHHSIPHMDALNDVSHPMDVVTDRMGIILISALVGFQYETVAWIFAFQSIRGRLLHSRAPINFGPLGAIFVDNRFHLSHHSVRPQYYDRNYGGVVTFYDRLFGTYEAPDPGVIEETGMVSKHPPRNLWQFFTARLDDRAPARAS